MAYRRDADSGVTAHDGAVVITGRGEDAGPAPPTLHRVNRKPACTAQSALSHVALHEARLWATRLYAYREKNHDNQLELRESWCEVHCQAAAQYDNIDE